MKKFIFVLLALLFPLMFSVEAMGNANASYQPNEFIKMQNISYSDGKVLQGFYISVNSAMLANNGATSEEITLFKDNIANSMAKLKEMFLRTYASIYINNPIEEFMIGKGGGLEFSIVKEYEGGFIGFQMLFTSSAAWNYYHPSSSNGSDEDKKEETIEFVSTVSSTGKIIFAQNFNEEQTYAEYLSNIYLSAGENLSSIDNLENIYNPKLIYEYATSSPKIHSNADYSYYSTLGLYHHLWERDLSSIQTENEMKLYYYKVNSQWWYLTIICIGVGVVGIGSAVVLVLNKRGKKKKEEKTA